MYVCHTYLVLGGVLREAGFAFPDATNAMQEGECQFFSAERLEDFDADWVFITYRTDREQTPADAVAGMESVLPLWCDALTACREGRVVYLPRAEATTPSYDAAMAIAFAVLTHLSQPHLQILAPLLESGACQSAANDRYRSWLNLPGHRKSSGSTDASWMAIRTRQAPGCMIRLTTLRCEADPRWPAACAWIRNH